jgi:predicted O-methyltransferase YrrM
MSAMNTLASPPVADELARLHVAARGDWKHRIVVAPRWILSRLTGRDFMRKSPSALRRAYAAVTREQGRFLYLLARATGARRIVEFGASFGISTLYLAAAARDNGGVVITTEIEPEKARGARENLRLAGLDEVGTVLEGDALETLRGVEGPIDLLFLDGMKDLYLPVLSLVRSRLRRGAVVVADNVDMPSAHPYAAHVRAPESELTSCTVFGGRTEISYVGGAQGTP